MEFLAYMMVGLGLVVAASWAYSKYVELSGSELDHKIFMIYQLVQAAEQTLGKESGMTRLEWVMAQLERAFPDADTEETRVLIEAAVWRVKQIKARVADGGGNDDDLDTLDFWVGSGRSN